MAARKRSARRRRPVEAFLSRAEADRGRTARLEQALARHDVAVWTAAANVRGAQAWHDEIGEALRRCDWFLLALSKRSVSSEWVKRELLFALQRETYRGRIVPIVLDKNCDVDALSWTLGSFQMVDFTGDFDDGCRSLLATWDIAFVPDGADGAGRTVKASAGARRARSPRGRR